MAYKKRSSSYKKKSYGERKDAHQMLAESILKNIEESNLVFQLEKDDQVLFLNLVMVVLAHIME